MEKVGFRTGNNRGKLIALWDNTKIFGFAACHVSLPFNYGVIMRKTPYEV